MFLVLTLTSYHFPRHLEDKDHFPRHLEDKGDLIEPDGQKRIGITHLEFLV